MTYAIVRTDSFYQAIFEIRDYLLDFTHPHDVAKVLSRIRDTVDGLMEMPTRHRRYPLPLPNNPEIRYAFAGSFIVYFIIDESLKIVSVLDVLHARRDPTFIRERLA